MDFSVLAVKTLRFNSLTEGEPTMRSLLTIEAAAGFFFKELIMEDDVDAVDDVDDSDVGASIPLLGG